MKISLTATDWQKEIFDAALGSETRFISAMAGRRSGKTIIFLSIMTLHAMMKPGSKIWYIGNSYGIAREQFDAISGHPSLYNRIKKTNLQPHPKITFKNGSTISFRSWERPHLLRGNGIDMCICDEIQSWQCSSGLFWSVIRPIISDKRGKILIGGQHRSTESWYYKDLFSKGLDTTQKLYRSWNIPSWRGIRYLSESGKKELEIMRSQMPRAEWEVEIACISRASEAAVFRYDDLDNTKIKGAMMEAELRQNGIDPYIPDNNYRQMYNRNYVLALDLGRIVDHAAITIMSDNFVYYSEQLPLKQRHEITARYVANMSKRWNDALVVVDNTGGATGGHNEVDAYIKFYRQEIDNMREFYITQKSKKNIIEALALSIERNTIGIPEKWDKLHKELSQFEYKLRAGSDMIQYSAPSGCHDDLVMSLAIANYSQKYITNTQRQPGQLEAMLHA